MTKQRTARLHPSLETRTRLCECDHGTTYTKVCNAALWHFFHVADGDARRAALQNVTNLLRRDSRKKPRSARRVPLNA